MAGVKTSADERASDTWPDAEGNKGKGVKRRILWRRRWGEGTESGSRRRRAPWDWGPGSLSRAWIAGDIYIQYTDEATTMYKVLVLIVITASSEVNISELQMKDGTEIVKYHIEQNLAIQRTTR